MAGDTQPRSRIFWVIYKITDLKLGSRLLRDLVKHPYPRDHEFCQISYGPPPLGINIDRNITKTYR